MFSGMASHVLKVADVWPAGTSVGVHLASRSPADSPPVSGAALASVAVAADGTLTFTGLADDTAYVALDSVGGRWRRFRSAPLVAGGSAANVLAQGIDATSPRAKNLLEAMNNLVAAWALDEASGTALADFGPNNIPLAKGAQGTVGGSAVLPEFAAALTAATGAGIAASAAVATGSPLQITNALTFGAWVRMGTPGTNRRIGGRNANFGIVSVGAAGVQQGVVTLGGSQKNAVGRQALAAGRRALVAVTYDGRELALIVNGVIECRVPFAGTITATTDAMEVGSLGSSNAFDGQLQGAFVFNRALSLGELRKLMRESDSTLDSTEGSALFDLLADDDAVIAASPATRYCGWCAGRMRRLEQAVVTPNDAFHPSCFAASRKMVRALASTSSIADYGSWALTLMRESFNGAAKRNTPDKTIYHDGTRWIGPGIGNAPGFSNWETTLGMGSGAALMARYLRAGAKEPWTKIVRLEVARTIANQMAYGGFEVNGSRVNVFPQMELGLMTLMTKGIVETSTWAPWKTAFLLGATYMRDGGGGFSPEISFYTNGNFAVMNCIVFWLAYRLTGDAAWQAALEQQFAFMIAPSPTADGNGVGARAAGYGLFDGTITADITATTTSGSNVLTVVTVLSGALAVGKPVTGPGIPGGSEISAIDGSNNITLIGPTGAAANATASAAGVSVKQHAATLIDAAALLALSDTTGKAYLAETPGSGINKPGLDWNYLQFQASLVTRMWQISGDTRFLKLMNVFRNKLQDRLSRATWTLDATGGTRVNSAISWLSNVEHVLVLKAGRSDITAADLAAQITTASTGSDANYRSQFLTNGNVSYYRVVGMDLGAMLMMQPDWPGTPA